MPVLGNIKFPDLTHSPRVIITTGLDGVRYRIRLQWLKRPAAWYLSVYKTDNTKVVSGIKLVEWVSLVKQYTAGRDLPLGFLWIVPLINVPISRYTIGDAHKMYYSSPREA